MGNWMGEAMGKPFALLLGRKTYEIFSRILAAGGRPPGRRRVERGHKVRGLANARLG